MAEVVKRCGAFTKNPHLPARRAEIRRAVPPLRIDDSGVDCGSD
jgi:hypothetical protein